MGEQWPSWLGRRCPSRRWPASASPAHRNGQTLELSGGNVFKKISRSAGDEEGSVSKSSDVPHECQDDRGRQRKC